MKKLLLLASLTIGFGLNAQELLTENCSFLTAGNVGTDLTGVTVGQGEWRIFGAAGTPLTDMQVVDVAGINGNAFQLTGSAVATGTRYIYNETIAETWTARTAGNNIAEVTYDFFTGPVSTSKNTQRLTLFDATGSKFLAGMMVTMDTKVVSGLSNFNNAGTIGNFSFGMGATAATPIVLLPNTWYKLAFSFNKTTGEVKFRATDGATVLFNRFVMGAATGTDVTELDMLVGAGTGNLASSVGVFDNIAATATATDQLLSVISPIEINPSNFTIYPNPATDIVTISSKGSALNYVVLTDINGRVVKQINDIETNSQINISDLSAGVYMMKISSSEGTTTKKLIKE